MGVNVEPLRELRQRSVEPGPPPQAVDRPESAGRDQPCAGIGWYTIRGPALHRLRKGLLHRLLGQVEVTEQADQSGEDPARVGAVDGVYHLPRRVVHILTHPWRASG